jgi:hypothetical protein
LGVQLVAIVVNVNPGVQNMNYISIYSSDPLWWVWVSGIAQGGVPPPHYVPEWLDYPPRHNLIGQVTNVEQPWIFDAAFDWLTKDVLKVVHRKSFRVSPNVKQVDRFEHDCQIFLVLVS